MNQLKIATGGECFVTDKKNAQDRETHGYGYDKSVKDLKVIGENHQSKNKVHDEQQKKDK